MRQLKALRTDLLAKHKAIKEEIDNFKSFIASSKQPNLRREFAEEMEEKMVELQRLHNEILEIEHELRDLKAQMPKPKETVSALERFQDMLEALPFEKRHEFIKLLVDRIDIFQEDPSMRQMEGSKEDLTVKLRTYAY